jgi:hypothetical protein
MRRRAAWARQWSSPTCAIHRSNRCSPSAGLGLDCAIAPDGEVFVDILSDNDILTAAGWRFDEPITAFPDPGAVPPEELATLGDVICATAACAAPCPGTEPLEYPALACPMGAPVDASQSGASDAIAALDGD